MTSTTGQPKARTTRRLRVRDIEVDHRVNMRRSLSKDAVGRYANAYRNEVNLPPIKVTPVKGGRGFLLVDGFHRLEALREAHGENEGGYLNERIEVEVVEAGGSNETRLIAGLSNMTHGVPMKRQELRAVFRAYGQVKLLPRIENGDRLEEVTYRGITRELHGCVSKSTVARWMKEEFPEVAKRMAKEDDGEQTGENGFPNTIHPAIRETLERAKALVSALAGVPERERETVRSNLVNILTEAAKGNGVEVTAKGLVDQDPYGDL